MLENAFFKFCIIFTYRNLKVQMVVLVEVHVRNIHPEQKKGQLLKRSSNVNEQACQATPQNLQALDAEK
jgi:hypothetical protein